MLHGIATNTNIIVMGRVLGVGVWGDNSPFLLGIGAVVVRRYRLVVVVGLIVLRVGGITAVSKVEVDVVVVIFVLLGTLHVGVVAAIANIDLIVISVVFLLDCRLFLDGRSCGGCRWLWFGCCWGS